MRTIDGGLHWQTASPDLTGAKQSAADSNQPVSIENAKERGYGVVYTITPSPLSAAQIWAGSDTGLIHLTRDGGKTWANVTPDGLTPWSKITQIEASRFNRGEAYAAVDRHRLDDMKPYLYRTRDFGKSWQLLTQGIAGNAFLNCIREDPKRKGLLFAGTEFGVYVSFNDGDEWLPLQLNLPVSSVRDIAIHGDDLVVATHGRAFWILDDIEPLRELAEKPPSADVRLYRPKPAIRMTSDAFWGSPLPVDEPQAQNPPRGAYLDYYLPARAAADVTLEISDARGGMVRRFSSRDKPETRTENLAVAERWLTEPQRLSAEAGMHRFVWDLRYGPTGANSAEDFDEEGSERWAGPLVLPGKYIVKLTIDGRGYTQPLEVVMDPRCRASKLELLEQFRWAQRVFEDLVVARRTVAQIQALEAELHKRSEQKSPATEEAIKTAIQTAGEIRTGGTAKPEQGLEAATRGLTAAFTALEGADRTPPSQVVALYRESATILKARLSEWAEFKARTLTALNTQIQAAGSAPLALPKK